ncbi:GNAT family N-acetyltransferase [Sphingomonas sp. FW199]|uniref:GNAT family N-acetyltransferase n=1 Tax=Sphingomonas sp. FW199 TaxID=3400217 RepID=UPI003CEFE498
MTAPVLATQRLILRLPEASDLDGWAEMNADGDAIRFLGGVKSRAVTWRELCTMRGAWDIRGFAMFSVIERDTGRWVGRIGPWQPEGWPGTEVGWGVHPGFAGRGYAHEAAMACMDYAVDVLGWTRVIHTIAPDNLRSIALARRLGSTNGGPVSLPPPHEAVQVDAWGQTADQWRSRRSA